METSALIHYKIRRKSDGLFSSGGEFPSFDAVGKVWTRHNHLSCHLALVVERLEGRGKNRKPWPYEDCEIVMVEYSYSHSLAFTSTLEKYKNKLSL